MLRTTCILGALALSLLFVSPARAADTAKGDAGIKEAARLCAAPYPTVEMACRTKDDRLVAICSRGNGPFQLVFAPAGNPQSRIVLPRDPADKTAVHVGSMLYSGGGGSYGRFKTAHGTEYVVFSGFGKGWEQAGLSEVKGEKHLADHLCLPAGKPYDIGFPVLNQKAGYAEDETQRFDVP